MTFVCVGCGITDTDTEAVCWTLDADPAALCLGCARVRRGLPRDVPPPAETKRSKKQSADLPIPSPSLFE